MSRILKEIKNGHRISFMQGNQERSVKRDVNETNRQSKSWLMASERN